MGIFIYLRIIYNEKWKISGKSLTRTDYLFRDGYTSVFIGTGVEMSLRLGIPGETLGNVHFGLNYLANPNAYRLGENVAVIGMGKDCRSRCGSRKKCRTAHVEQTDFTQSFQYFSNGDKKWLNFPFVSAIMSA